MRRRTNRRVDKRIFRNTASKVAAANLSGYMVPRGGYRL